MAQDDTTDTLERICELATPIILQKQRLAFYNIPPPRLNIVSPYPTYTKEQLDMRRKVEVLKYSGVQQNTKTNNFTKKQLFANLAKNSGSSKKVSQYLTNSNNGLLCVSNSTKPTSTTASNIPGPPMILQYDPTVPLYNYGNHKNNRSYAITNKPLEVEFSPYSKSIIDIIREQYTFPYDDIYGNDTPNLTYYGELGDLVIKNTSEETGYSFNIYTPIAVWFNACIGAGSKDEFGVVTIKPTLITDLSLNINITSIIVTVYYNDTLIQQTVPIRNGLQNRTYTPPIPDNTFATTVCNIKKARNENPADPIFYALNYVGMLKVDIPLQTPPQTVYTFKYEVNYTYNSQSVNTYLDYIQTGVYASLITEYSPDVVNEPYIYNCDVSSSPVNKTTFSRTMFTPYYDTNTNG